MEGPVVAAWLWREPSRPASCSVLPTGCVLASQPPYSLEKSAPRALLCASAHMHTHRHAHIHTRAHTRTRQVCIHRPASGALLAMPASVCVGAGSPCSLLYRARAAPSVRVALWRLIQSLKDVAPLPLGASSSSHALELKGGGGAGAGGGVGAVVWVCVCVCVCVGVGVCGCGCVGVCVCVCVCVCHTPAGARPL